ncbi:site-specific integrase [Escherichia coli]|uniref:site-specific integrase n=1 Tax=Escherichia coli TaxID=562 RepID=UPI000BE19B09|nr:site-specific integrase [Escherichia coli]ECZ1391290.1 site-specific integrase [Salmonella enterica subsp. enterica serovar Schwarzengrund]EKS5943528.1 site-specific integrase [Salmonella enterica]EET5618328.1 site-specific integrase [Escherichia coli]EET5689689.1 site-specific integrase [Escherichia coli]EET6341987.1 site-specific integrase [Escherichia coli]
MANFAKAEKQAASVMKVLQGTVIRSVGTVRNYEQALTRVCEWVKSSRACDGLRGLTPQLAVEYLETRGEAVGQKTLDMERQAIQAMMHHVTGVLLPDETLPVIRSQHPQILTGRAYTPTQVELIASAQTPRNALATRIAYAAGLRAHELHTLAKPEERPASIRPARDSKWTGREGVLYTVQGKGGLIREVLIPSRLAAELENYRHPDALTVTDRGIHYLSRYNIGAGKAWTNSFSAAATRVLNWSSGAHGLRHSYAQERIRELQQLGLSREDALTTVSQEMGHFRPEITETYLR